MNEHCITTKVMAHLHGFCLCLASDDVGFGNIHKAGQIKETSNAIPHVVEL